MGSYQSLTIKPSDKNNQSTPTKASPSENASTTTKQPTMDIEALGADKDDPFWLTSLALRNQLGLPKPNPQRIRQEVLSGNYDHKTAAKRIRKDIEAKNSQVMNSSSNAATSATTIATTEKDIDGENDNSSSSSSLLNDDHNANSGLTDNNKKDELGSKFDQVSVLLKDLSNHGVDLSPLSKFINVSIPSSGSDLRNSITRDAAPSHDNIHPSEDEAVPNDVSYDDDNYDDGIDGKGYNFGGEDNSDHVEVAGGASAGSVDDHASDNMGFDLVAATTATATAATTFDNTHVPVIQEPAAASSTAVAAAAATTFDSTDGTVIQEPAAKSSTETVAPESKGPSMEDGVQTGHATAAAAAKSKQRTAAASSIDIVATESAGPTTEDVVQTGHAAAAPKSKKRKRKAKAKAGNGNRKSKKPKLKTTSGLGQQKTRENLRSVSDFKGPGAKDKARLLLKHMEDFCTMMTPKLGDKTIPPELYNAPGLFFFDTVKNKNDYGRPKKDKSHMKKGKSTLIIFMPNDKTLQNHLKDAVSEAVKLHWDPRARSAKANVKECDFDLKVFTDADSAWDSMFKTEEGK